MSEITFKQIKEICKKVSVGYVGPTTEYFTDKENGIPFLRSKNVRLGKLDYNDLAFVTREFHEKNKKSQLKRGDVVIVRVGQNRGDVCKISDEFKELNVANCVFLRPKKGLSDYLELILRSNFGQKLLLSISTGSAQEVLNTGAIADLEIPIPSIAMIEYSSKIINLLDHKITLLHQQNETLEELAQLLFRRWFVDFEFPDKDGKPYKRNGGKMVESELGEIPEGWEVKPLINYLIVINGYSYKGVELLESNEALVTLKNFDRTGGFRMDGFKELKSENYKERHIVNVGDLIVAHTDLTQDAEVLGNPAIIMDNEKYDRFIISMDLVKVKSIDKKLTTEFLYYLMKDRRFKLHCKGYSNGTTVLHLAKNAIPEYLFAFPNDFQKVLEFGSYAKTTYSKISKNNKEIQTLTQLRDTLLPKLMSGEVRVKID